MNKITFNNNQGLIMQYIDASTQQRLQMFHECQFFKTYVDYFRMFINLQQILTKPKTQDLIKHKIKLLQKSSENTVIIKSKYSKNNINFYKVNIGIFNAIIYVYDCTDIMIKKYQKIGQGAYSTVYRQQFQNIQFAIKTIFIDQNLDRQNIIKKTVLEIAFLKICSLLKIGPSIITILQYDILVYKNCIQCPMQLCVSWKNKFQIYTTPFQNHIKQNLFFLHLMNIVHRDIKPENIMYSNTYKRYVFIDFGSCKYLKQNIGQNSLSQYEGTAQFMIQQLRKSSRKQEIYINLYNNDIFGVQKTLQIYQNELQKKEEKKQNSLLDLYFEYQIEAKCEQKNQRQQNWIKNQQFIQFLIQIKSQLKNLMKQISQHDLHNHHQL